MFKFSEISDMCIKCGKCIPGCTIHRVNPDEATSPRGFLDILKGVEEGEIEIDKNFKDTVESCFLCNQCVEVCPNSLPTDFMIENARAKVAEKFGIAWYKRAFFFLLKHRWAYDLVSKLGFYFQTCGFKIEEEKKAIRSRFSLPMLHKGRLLPAFRKTSFLKKYPEKIPAKNPQKRVAIFIGCMANYNYTEVGDALVKILKFLDIDIFIPKKQACCGAPAYFTGDFKTTEELIKRNIEYFETFIDEVDAILVPEATCTAMLKKDYEEYIKYHMDYEWLKRHEKVKAKIFGTTEWLYKYTDLEKRLNKKLNSSVTYHDACHFGKVFNIRKEPRALISKVVEVKEMEDPNVCCGFGGITMQTEKFDLARKEGLIKAEMIKKVDAEYVSAECSACRMQITEHLDKVGDNKIFVHPLEIIAKAIED
ncbi:(Fe-S)-binding protein [Caminibacter pacificus]|uniref:Glycolate oxidase iron-sulfur subunit n=1 Tax=Caminibacter pacificus TaxID=1424653 RepID=A0AAJ4RDI3_9BACT|nr:(Fe-S)-binding protein [Caminibacter pacificus]QCI28680.1 (Fe-S)-binding protein [Caminibacter pacificus]ROR40589.1 glycolate oxidase iron-sulfur subunit [Caminibacter pacificus]